MMNTYFRALALVLLTTLAASCKKDDDSTVAIRDYTEQYATEKADLEEYLHTHYIVSVDADFNVEIDTLTNPVTQTSIWDQTDYPLQHKEVNLSNLIGNSDTENNVTYTLYYISFNEGTGKKPSRADDIIVSYKGLLTDGTVFDNAPFPVSPMNLYSDVYVEGWKEIIPLFRGGTYVDEPNSPDPAHYEGYGAGMMFIPSGLAYYNSTSGLVGSYDTLIFSFKLLDVNYIDTDGDGLDSHYEYGLDPTADIGYVDTDGDDTPDFLDSDDDDDGYYTYEELQIPGTGEGNNNPVQFYEFDAIPTCTSGIKRHIDASCHN